MKTPMICWRALGSRVMSLTLALALLLSLIPALTPQAQAASWMTPYLEKVQEWGVMRGDIQGNLNEDQNITRAEFVTMVNRAYGYTETGKNPYKDTTVEDWFYEDLGIAYHTGYFAGTSANTASPLTNLTREQAATLLGRNMMLEEGTGETLAFTDSRSLSSWSRQMVEAAAKEGFISGYPDGTFQPQGYVTRGEVASMLVRAVGQPIQDSGVQSLGVVNSNLTITAPGVTLRDTTVNGNLYISAGVGLGNAVLENVDVRGKIVVAGAGESEEGEHSVVLRNVEADALVMDSLSDQFVTLRAEGDTDIKTVYARTQVYLEDMTDDGKGLQNILLKAEEKTPFQLAGNMKNVRLETSGSTLTIAQGVTKTLTVDEAALKTTVDIQNKAIVTTVNLDAAATITGQGDISHLNVNVPGSTVAMLPDTITIRPGVTADIAGVNMDSVAAVEASENPRLLAGYPKEQNVAPTSAEVLFKANKSGTLYWGLTALADGSLDEDELIKPPAYSGKILKSGSIKITASGTEFLTKLSGLVSDGSYYVSAVLVDSRGMRSAVKVVAFTTPDNTAPKFMQSEMTLVTNEDAQVTIMANKTCQLYWAVLPKGSTAPKAADFKAGAIEGNLGSGNMQVTKNSTHPFYVNSPSGNLVEQQTYDLYLWLTDFDGAKSSAVKKITFTTVDKTPPIVTSIYQSNQAAKTITVTFEVNEAATLYWGVVLAGDTFIRPSGNDTEPPAYDELAAKVQVEAGTYAIKKGNKSVSKSGTATTFTISGLSEQTSYDLYYVAKDKAGNYSERVQVLQGIKTQDTKSPTVEQEFTEFTSSGNPLPETDVELHFSEEVWGVYQNPGDNTKKYHDFLSLYNDVLTATTQDQKASKKETLAKALRQYITLYTVDATTGKSEAAVDKAEVEDDANKKDTWVIDYREAQVIREEGKTTIVFPTNRNNVANGALNLASGGTYYFKLNSITDTSGNAMPTTELKRFTTVFAKVTLGGVSQTVQITKDELKNKTDSNLDNNDVIRVDMSFTMYPESTERVPDGTKWDMLLWTDSTMNFTLYSREEGNETWTKEGDITATISDSIPGGKVYASLTKYVRSHDYFEDLKGFTKSVEFAIHVTKVDDDPDYVAWNKNITMGVNVIAGTTNAVGQAGINSLGDKTHYQRAMDTGAVSIGVDDPFEVSIPFTDKEAPSLNEGYPSFDVGDVAAEMQINLNRPGTIYYVAVPVSGATAPTTPGGAASGMNYTADLMPRNATGNLIDLNVIPTSGDGTQTTLSVTQPYINQIINPRGLKNAVYGNTTKLSSPLSANQTYYIDLEDLTPSTTYLVYLVIQGISPVYSETLCYQFTTLEAQRPCITMNITNPIVNIFVDKTSEVDYILAVNGQEDTEFKNSFNQYVSAETKVSLGGENKYLKTEYTVLNAMSDTITQDGQDGTVFDFYATDLAKETFAQKIKASSVQSSNIKMVGKGITIKMDEMLAVDCADKMGINEYHTMIAVAKAKTGSGYAFRANWPVFNADTTPPYITSNTFEFMGVTDTNGVKKISGTLRLSFSEPLYIKQTGSTEQTYLPLDGCTASSTSHDADDGYESIGNVMTYSGKIYPVAGVHGKACQSLTFNLAEAVENATITFNATLCDNRGNVQEKLTLTLKSRTVGTGDEATTEYYFGYPDSWSAASNTTDTKK